MLVGHRTLVDLFIQLSEKEKLASGYIFFGQDQVGKKTFAESLAHYLEGRDFEPSSHILQDTLRIEPTNESIGIDTARKIKSYLSETPIASARRIVIVNQAQMLTLQAENALLKISEETPQHSLIIFITTNPEALLGTLSSRLQKIYFGPVANKELERMFPGKGISSKEREGLMRVAAGSPGRLKKLFGEEGSVEETARKVIAASPETRKKLLKEYLDEDESPLALLDALLLISFADSKRKTALILNILKAKRELSTLNLNSRLQLENIFS